MAVAIDCYSSGYSDRNARNRSAKRVSGYGARYGYAARITCLLDTGLPAMSGPLEQRCRAAAEQCAWLLLGSVGMSTASSARVNHSVSPEDALLVASIGSETDRRLRDEARDWFLEFDDLISRPALKHP